MRLCFFIALLSIVLCATADGSAVVRIGQVLLDAVGCKLLLPGTLPSGTSPQAQVTGSQWCSPQSWEIRSSTLETPLVSAAGRGPCSAPTGAFCGHSPVQRLMWSSASLCYCSLGLQLPAEIVPNYFWCDSFKSTLSPFLCFLQGCGI